MSNNTRTFKIEYSKHSSGGSIKWEAGFLIQCLQGGKVWIWLKNSNKVTIREGCVDATFLAKLDSRETLTCAGFKIRILCENERFPTAGALITTDHVTSNSAEVEVVIESTSFGKDGNLKIRGDSMSCQPSVKSSVPQKAFLDPVLLRSMRSYQIEAASFLLNRLQDGRCSLHPCVNASSLNSGLPLTGAILADDMGTGKTLVGLAVMWALCRHGQGKGIIVCPSSLIQNWRKEINKWLPKTARTTIYISGGQGSGKANDLDVHSFVSSHPSVHPLLVISYDMFRIYAEAFNTMLTLHTMLCDEGHRLKNSVGTKTSLALGNCTAMQRLVLTGTPIQNNLDELYAVVNFTVPGYLGTLEEFQREFAKDIAAGNDPQAPPKQLLKAEAARNALSRKLQTILIRRTGDTLLRDMLPRRREFVVAVWMTGSQRERYVEVAQGLVRSADDVPIVTEDTWQQTGTSRKRTTHSSSSSSSSPSLVLPGLQCLRVLCSSGTVLKDTEEEAAETEAETETEIVVGRGDKRARSDGGGGECPPRDCPPLAAGSIADIMSKSSKLHVLYSILRYMKSSKLLRREKIVIASNFISTLDTIEPIIKAAGHQFLRIDGKVASDKRQSIVDLFNNDNSAFTVCLISVKAGGVGLNLIGANRLILIEPDYNPATDQQAIGRVWRVGQKKEVFIYRMVCASTIEESIIGRQRHKNLLSSVIMESKTDKNGSIAQEKEGVVPPIAAVVDISSYDFSSQAPGVLLELVLPGGGPSSDDSPAAARSSRSVMNDHKEDSSDVTEVGKTFVEYDDVVLNELLSDQLVRCRVEVKHVM